MMKLLKLLTPIATAIVLALPFGTVSAQAGEGKGPILLTITGNVSLPNRDGYDENVDKFFGYTEIEFDKAAMFSFASLKKLGSVAIKADFPKGRQVHVYEGPLLADVLTAAGATGKTVTVRALDGYAVEAPFEEMIAQGAVVAYMRDGKMFGIGDFGPTQIVFPRAERDDLSEMTDDRWVWSIFHIHVE